MNALRRTTVATLMALALGLLSAAPAPAADKPKPEPKPKPTYGPESLVGKPAADFSLPTLDGKRMRLADDKGKVVVLYFWAMWSPPCSDAMLYFQHLHSDEKLAAKGLKIYAINSGEKNEERIKEYVKKHEATLPVPLDPDRVVVPKYDMDRGLPVTFVVGRDGKIAWALRGFGPAVHDRVRDAINEALDKDSADDKAEEKATAREGASGRTDE